MSRSSSSSGPVTSRRVRSVRKGRGAPSYASRTASRAMGAPSAGGGGGRGGARGAIGGGGRGQGGARDRVRRRGLAVDDGEAPVGSGVGAHGAGRVLLQDRR